MPRFGDGFMSAELPHYCLSRTIDVIQTPKGHTMQFSIVDDNYELPRTWIASSRERTAEFA